MSGGGGSVSNIITGGTDGTEIGNSGSSLNANVTAMPAISGDVRIKGGTDAAIIGNISDKLKVDANISSIGTISPAFSSKARVVVLTTPVTLDNGSYTTFYSYSGSGILISFNVEFNNISTIVRLQIDGEEIFGGVAINTLNGLIGTGNDASRRGSGSGIVCSSATLDFSLRQPIKYNTSIVISGDGNGAAGRTFTQGIVYLTKET